MAVLRGGSAVLAVVVLAELAWGGLYIGRTSFVHEAERVFCLWDDAMISMQYARNLAEGWGLVWNADGERVWGVTNLGVTLAMAALHLLPVGESRVSLLFQLLNLAALVALLILVQRTALRAARDPVVAGAAVLGSALLAPLQVWSLQGADTGLLALWLMIALYGLARGLWPRWIFPWLALGLWLRPDALVFCAAFWLASLLFPGDRLGRLAGGAAWLAASGGGLALFGWLYYGDPLPNTFYLKATGAPRLLMLRSGLAELLHWPLGLVTALPLVAAVLVRRPEPVWRVAALGVVLALAYNVWVGGDWKGEYGSRFVAPVLPLLVLLSAAGARALVPVALGVPGRAAAVGIAALSVALLSSPRAALLDWLVPGTTPMLFAENRENHAAALYLREHTRPGASVAVHYGGVPPYFSRLRAIDVLGKSDRHIARLEVDRFVPGHSKWDWDYVLGELEPDLFLGTSRGLGLRGDFRRSYYRVRTREGLEFFVRRASLGVLTDPSIALFDPSSGRPVPVRDGLDPRRRRSDK